MGLAREIDKTILERLAQWYKKGKTPPTRMVILPTNRCNLRCIFCRRLKKKTQTFLCENELSDEEWLEIIEEANELGFWNG